ncbi:PTS sugar transporter subunit IIA [Fundicoccus culcitae]|uniref:PTS EIIA type-4 domain-containing protein n=1 Tax=Fundicoccus culcitae TaxID=2969821 RepID=A0ABY5P8U1_9LACT|nr:hypothetical protein [Fundicoccus culcitae]UUX35168.1 hypothetical protein NRE15_05870 [Fundicoccus culcitae]
MLKLFLASHGRLASGMESSVNVLLGGVSNLTIFDAYLDEKNIHEVLNSFFENINEEDQVIMLSDLLGGSVNQVMYTYLNKKNTKLISGINLAILLELCMYENPIDDEKILSIINEGKNSIQLINNSTEFSEIEDDFF